MLIRIVSLLQYFTIGKLGEVKAERFSAPAQYKMIDIIASSLDFFKQKDLIKSVLKFGIPFISSQ